MPPIPRSRRIVPAILGAAMLAVVISSVVFPNANVALPQSNCGSPSCASSTSAWVYGSIAGVLIAVALAFALVLLRRRRRSVTRTGPLKPRQDEAGPGAPPTASPATPPTPPAPPPGAAPVYLETPEDVGREPPTVPDWKEVDTVAATDQAAEPDAGSTAAELDRIVRELQRRSQKKGNPPQVEPAHKEDPR